MVYPPVRGDNPRALEVWNISQQVDQLWCNRCIPPTVYTLHFTRYNVLELGGDYVLRKKNEP